MVQIYPDDYTLVAQHDRAGSPGTRRTHPEHLPPEKLDGLRSRADCVQQAAQIGPNTAQIVDTLLADPVLDRLPTVRRLLKLEAAYGPARLEAACERALSYGDPAYATVKRILAQHLDAKPLPVTPPAPSTAATFIRSAADLVGSFLGGFTWTL